MSSKLIFLLLTALLLVQCSVGKPMPDADTVAEVSKDEESKKESKAGDSSEAISDENSEENALVSLFVGECMEVVDLLLNNIKKLIVDVVGDVNAMEEKSEALTIRINKLNAYANKLDKIDFKDEDSVMERLDLLKEMMASPVFYNTKTDKPNAEDLIILASLKKHGFENVLEDIKVQVLKSVVRFFVAANKYLNSLSTEEKQGEEKEFLEWFQQFTNYIAMKEKL